MELINNFNAEEEVDFPVYEKYESQSEAQPAYICLDTETGAVYATYDGNIGGGCSQREFNNIVLRFPIHPESHRDVIHSLITDNAKLFQQVLDGASERWNGNNYVGAFDESALRAIEELENIFRGLERDERYPVESLAEWLDGDSWSEPNQTLNDYAEHLLSYDGDNGGVFCSSFNDLEGMKDTILEIWKNDLYNDEDLPPHVAQAIIDDDDYDLDFEERLTELANG